MRLKTIAAVAVLALSAGLVLAACGSDDDNSAGGGYGGDRTQTQAGAEEAPPKPAIETIVVRDGAPVDGVAELEYDAGEEVRFRVRSNTADEIHVHGYDVTKEVPAGGSVTVSFPAELEGIYEAELHGSGEQIAEIRVNP
jgi:hypothetical protein